MRKTLLMTAAALAAGVISSQAQGVYSQNIVGYVNQPMTGGNSYFVSVPFTIGVSNGANEIYGTNLPNTTQLNVWNGSGFTINYYDTNPNFNGDTSDHWYMNDDSTVTNPPILPPGLGFLLNPNGNVTNTYAGAVLINVGTTNIMNFVGGLSYFVGCPVPYGGSVTNYGTNYLGTLSGGANFNNLPNTSQVDFWNGSGFTINYYDTNPNFNGDTTDHWYMNDDSTVTNPPSITPGESFLFNPNGSYSWQVGL